MIGYTAVMGNPPYTVQNKGTNTGAFSVYMEFIALACILGTHSSLLTPGRWLVSPKAEAKRLRKELQEGQTRFHTILLTYKDVFDGVSLRGGVSFYFHKEGWQQETTFITDYKVSKAEMFDSTGTIAVDEIDEIRKLIWGKHQDQAKPSLNYFHDWSQMTPSFTSKNEGTGNEVFKKFSSEEPKYEENLKIWLLNGPRFFDKSHFKERDYTPKGRFAFAFAHCSSDLEDSLNDKSSFYEEFTASRSSSAVMFESLQQVQHFYKYARTKFFAILMKARISSHHAYPQAYQDIPMFSFDENDPIDWSKSIPEIDNQLIAHFGLEDYREYILSASKPYARELGQEYLDRLSEANVDVSGINEWY